MQRKITLEEYQMGIVDEYQKAAMGVTWSDIYRTGPRDTQLLVAALGLISESGEVGRVAFFDAYKQSALIEELGDCQWYVCLLGYLAGVQLREIFKSAGSVQRNRAAPFTAAYLLMLDATCYAALLKKRFEGNQDWLVGLSTMTRACLALVQADINIMCEWLQLMPGDLMAANLAKLRSRYVERSQRTDSHQSGKGAPGLSEFQPGNANPNTPPFEVVQPGP